MPQRNFLVLTLSENSIQSQKYGLDEAFKIIIEPKSVIQRASSPFLEVCSGLIAPYLSSPVFIQHLSDINLIQTHCTAILVVQRQQKCLK